MEKKSDIKLTRDSEACQEAINLLESGVSYEDLYRWRPDFREWRWAHLSTLTPRQAKALERVAPLEFWLRAVGNLDIWESANLYSANLYSANLVRANL